MASGRFLEGSPELDDLDELPGLVLEAGEAGGGDSDWQPLPARKPAKRIPHGTKLRKTAGKASIQ